MKKILLAVDGSKYTRHAARVLATQVKHRAKAPEVFLLHVCPPLPYPGAAATAGKKAVQSYQHDMSVQALAVAEKELAKAHVKFKSFWQVGDVAETIAAFVKANGIELVVLGSHGHGALMNLALGSVATKCIAALNVPVLVVPSPKKG